MTMSNREQLYALFGLIFAILAITLSPLITSVLIDTPLSDSLIAVADKTVTGLVGVLGTVSAMVFRSNRADQAATENTGKAFDAIRAASETTPPASK